MRLLQMIFLFLGTSSVIGMNLSELSHQPTKALSPEDPQLPAEQKLQIKALDPDEVEVVEYAAKYALNLYRALRQARQESGTEVEEEGTIDCRIN
jgi:hypothetical protein